MPEDKIEEAEYETEFTVKFKYKKETENTVQYKEMVGRKPPKIGTLYVKKWQYNDMGNPDQIEVTVKVD